MFYDFKEKFTRLKFILLDTQNKKIVKYIFTILVLPIKFSYFESK